MSGPNGALYQWCSDLPKMINTNRYPQAPSLTPQVFF
jgi:hypothetical protein